MNLTILHRWRAHLLKPVNGASLAAFRILFGSIMAWEVVRYFQHGRVERYYITPTFHFTYPFFGFVRPWPGDGMVIHFVVLGVLAVFIALGLFYRIAAPLFFVAFTYVFLLDKANYLNHFYLIILFSFLLIVVPAHRVASVDRLLFFKEREAVVPRWSVFVLRAQVFVVYFYGGLAKLNADWLQGEPMRMWLGERTDFPLIGGLFGLEWMVFLFAYGGLLFDLVMGFLLSWRRTRLVGFGMAAGFHLLNARLFHIGIFPILMFSATLIFAEPDWPQRIFWMGRRLAARIGVRPLRSPDVSAGGRTAVAASTRPMAILALGLVHLYLVVQLLFPLRHFLYPGNVSWTEEGHRFAWHMKLRDKEARLRMYVTDARTGDRWEVSPAVDLSRRQYEKMLTRPDMVLQYAHFLAEKLSIAGQPAPLIHVDLEVSLNGRPYQTLIDPAVNLGQVPITHKAGGWILPLEIPLNSQAQAATQ